MPLNGLEQLLSRLGGSVGQNPATAPGPVPVPFDPVHSILSSVSGRSEFLDMADILNLRLGQAQKAYGSIEPLVSSLFDRARADLIGAYGGERQRVADTQSQLQGRLTQQLSQRRLGGTTLGGSLSSALEQQGLRQYQGIADTQGRSLAALGGAEAGARAGALGAFGSFLERRHGAERDILENKLGYRIGRSNKRAAEDNARLGGLGSLLGGAFGLGTDTFGGSLLGKLFQLGG